MSDICGCPKSGTLPNIPAQDCPFDIGQVRKIVFQRLNETPGKLNGITADPTLLATWTPFFAANDNTKMVITPTINAPTTDGGDAITTGGGNDTPGGVEEITGRNLITFTAELRRTSPEIIAALRQLECEIDDLGVYLVTTNKTIVGQKFSVTAGEETSDVYRPIPITSFFVSALNLGGLDARDSNTISWSFSDPLWSDNLAVINPAFDPLRELVNPTA